MPKIMRSLALAVLFCPFLAAQHDQYLDILVVKVKPERRADFDAICRHIAEANRNNQGDHWLTVTAEYGDQNTVRFVSTRANYAAIDQASSAFLDALQKEFGAEGTAKLFHEFDKTSAGSRGELVSRRWDLSVNVPQDDAAMMKLTGGARWVRTTAVHVRPTHAEDYAAQIRIIKAAAERGGLKMPVFVTQSAVGQQGIIFYATVLSPDLATFDQMPTLAAILGEAGYHKYLQAIDGIVLDTETTLWRVSPEMSAMPEAVTSVAPDFWKPKSSPPPVPEEPEPKTEHE